MFRICLVTLLLLGVGYQAGEAAMDSDDNLLSFVDRITNLLQKKCLKNVDQQAFNEIFEVLDHLQYDCFTLPIGPMGGTTDEMMARTCREHNEKIMQCLTTFGEKLEPCLDSEEIYLKQFIPDVYSSSSEHVCDFIKSINIRLLLQVDNSKCLKTIREHPDINPHIVCYQNSSIIGDHPTVDIITKDELCSNVQLMDLCLSESFNTICPNEPEIERFQRGLLFPGFQNCMDVDIKNN